MTSGLTVRRPVLLLVFALSGASGLIYESIWSHYLKLFLGHAAYAQTLVLAIFMGGMALGSWLVARSTYQLKNLLLGYAIVEALTGVLALVFHAAYLRATTVAFDAVIPGLQSPVAIQLFKWSLAAVLILPQSVLMGTTFPLISGALVRRFPDSSAHSLAMLYFTNSLGAAAGVLIGGFVLIGRVGLPGTVMTAGLLNLVLALVVWLMTRGSQEPSPARNAVPVAARSMPDVRRWLLLAAALAGLAAFLYEVAWIRMLSLVLGASTHAFELMLSAFILGLALGGLWVRRRAGQWRDPARALAIQFALMAATATLTLPAYGATFELMAAALRMFAHTDAGYAGFNLVSHAIAALMMIPTTFVAGMTLPLMTHWLLRSGEGESAIGAVYAANTAGAIGGVILAVHGLLPQVGVKGTVIGGAIVQVVIAVLFLQRAQPRTGSTAMAAMGATVAAGLLVAVLAVTVHLDPLRMASSVYRGGVARLPESIHVTYLKDGKTATVTLAQDGSTVYIATNGKTDAAINMGAGAPAPDEITMVMLGAMPLALHPQPLRVANIGIGSGLTSQVLLASSRVRQLDSVEIESAMTEAARIGFGPRVERLFADSRSRIHIEDAKSFFAAAREPYDVIVSEPSNPWVSGVATLFSAEYYRQIRRYLREDGLLVQWLQIYDTDAGVIASVIKALQPNFADYAVYGTDNANMLIVARATGELLRLDERIFSEPQLRAELARVGLAQPGQLALRQVADRAMLDAIVGTYGVPANSDFFPFVDLNAPRMRFLGRDALAFSTLNTLPIPLARLLGVYEGLSLTPPLVPASSISDRELGAVAAQALVQALQSGESAVLAPDAVADVWMVRAGLRECASPTARQLWLAAVARVTERTVAYLDTAAQAQHWKQIDAAACASGLDEDDRQWLAFLGAMAHGTRGELAARGQEWLDSGNAALTPTQMTTVVLATSAALIGDGRRAQASALLHRFLPRMGDPGRYELAFRTLVGLADSPR